MVSNYFMVLNISVNINIEARALDALIIFKMCGDPIDFYIFTKKTRKDPTDLKIIKEEAVSRDLQNFC